MCCLRGVFAAPLPTVVLWPSALGVARTTRGVGSVGAVMYEAQKMTLLTMTLGPRERGDMPVLKTDGKPKDSSVSPRRKKQRSAMTSKR